MYWPGSRDSLRHPPGGITSLKEERKSVSELQPELPLPTVWIQWELEEWSSSTRSVYECEQLLGMTAPAYCTASRISAGFKSRNKPFQSFILYQSIRESHLSSLVSRLANKPNNIDSACLSFDRRSYFGHSLHKALEIC